MLVLLAFAAEALWSSETLQSEATLNQTCSAQHHEHELDVKRKTSQRNSVWCDALTHAACHGASRRTLGSAPRRRSYPGSLLAAPLGKAVRHELLAFPRRNDLATTSHDPTRLCLGQVAFQLCQASSSGRPTRTKPVRRLCLCIARQLHGLRACLSRSTACYLHGKPAAHKLPQSFGMGADH